ncbi:MAG TPA: DUF2065 domain-containing protein [Burkholderiales bacterium]|nr:DUF2065 domain-containing protein [Burkholderiales bacterium]
MLRHLVQAFALMFFLEGVLPFLLPDFWKQAFVRVMQLSDGQVRFIGLTSMASGLFMLFLF